MGEGNAEGMEITSPPAEKRPDMCLIMLWHLMGEYISFWFKTEIDIH